LGARWAGGARADLVYQIRQTLDAARVRERHRPGERRVQTSNSRELIGRRYGIGYFQRQIFRRFVGTPALINQYEREQVGRVAYVGVVYAFGAPKKSKTDFDYEQ
jgi:hypothetical protein